MASKKAAKAKKSDKKKPAKGKAGKAPAAAAKGATTRGKGPHPGVRFAKQAGTLARVMREHGVSFTSEGETYDAASIATLANEQSADEDNDAALLKAYNDFHPGFTARSKERGATFSSALDAVRGALKRDKAALVELKDARFTVGNPGGKNGAKGTPPGGAGPAKS